MKLYLAGDHAGFELKTEVAAHLQAQGHTVADLGPHAADSVDYPDYIHPLAKHLKDDPEALGIAICGSGNGVCMTANKHPHVRAALVWLPELAELARQHNNANVLCLPARFLQPGQGVQLVDAWLGARFEGGRHERRVAKIAP